jgi:hypothetical protein
MVEVGGIMLQLGSGMATMEGRKENLIRPGLKFFAPQPTSLLSRIIEPQEEDIDGGILKPHHTTECVMLDFMQWDLDRSILPTWIDILDGKRIQVEPGFEIGNRPLGWIPPDPKPGCCRGWYESTNTVDVEANISLVELVLVYLQFHARWLCHSYAVGTTEQFLAICSGPVLNPILCRCGDAGISQYICAGPFNHVLETDKLRGPLFLPVVGLNLCMTILTTPLKFN